MRAYAPRFEGDVDLWGLTGPASRPRLRALSEPRGRPSSLRARASSRRVAIRPSSCAPSPRTPISWACRARRRWRRRCTPSTSCRGFVLACAYVRPDGLVGMTPKSVKKKLKQPSFAAAVDRDELRHGAADLGVDFDEHLQIVIDALTERREELLAGRRRVRCPDGARRRSPDHDRRPRGRPDRPGAARAVRPLLDPELLGTGPRAARFDLSLENRRATLQPGRDRGRRRCARRARSEGGHDHSRGRRRRRLAKPDPSRGGRGQGDHPNRPAATRGNADRGRPLPDLDCANGG